METMLVGAGVGVGVGVGGWWGLATQGVQRYSDLPHLDLVALHQN
jgi:hypothetical protein